MAVVPRQVHQQPHPRATTLPRRLVWWEWVGLGGCYCWFPWRLWRQPWRERSSVSTNGNSAALDVPRRIPGGAGDAGQNGRLVNGPAGEVAADAEPLGGAHRDDGRGDGVVPRAETGRQRHPEAGEILGPPSRSIFTPYCSASLSPAIRHPSASSSPQSIPSGAISSARCTPAKSGVAIGQLARCGQAERVHDGHSERVCLVRGWHASTFRAMPVLIFPPGHPVRSNLANFSFACCSRPLPVPISRMEITTPC